MLRPLPPLCSAHCRFILRLPLAAMVCVLGLIVRMPAHAEKITASVIVASIEGEVDSLNMVDDFKVSMDASSVGKKISPKTMLATGKTGKVALLFSNGTLLTIKPGSRFYLRTYKQLEEVVDGVLDPGKLEEEPTKSELSAHLDFGELVVKAPKLKKGSSMKLTSPLGTAGIRGTMFQMMAVRNSVTGDISGGINLISGDIDFTDTGGNQVTLLSGQSIQLATSKLGEPVASLAGELTDLSSTYGPALTDGFSPPPLESIFPGYSEAPASTDESGEDAFPTSVASDAASFGLGTAGANANWEMIHELATDIFFEIEQAEVSTSGFSFESLALAVTVDVPTPEPASPSAPASVTGETEAGGPVMALLFPPPDITFTEFVDSPLLRANELGSTMVVELRASDEETWDQIDPGILGKAFTGYELQVLETWSPSEPLVRFSQLSLSQQENLLNPGAPEEILSLGSFSVNYSARDNSNLVTNKQRVIEVQATRPGFVSDAFPALIPMTDPNKTYDKWFDSVVVTDVRGEKLSYSSAGPLGISENGYFYLDPVPDLDPKFTEEREETITFFLRAVDWRGVKSEKEISFLLKATDAETSGTERLEPELSDLSLMELDPQIDAEDEFGNPLVWPEDIKLLSIFPGKFEPSVARLDQLADRDYLLTYLVTDSRGVGVEETRTVRVKASGPTLSIPDFESKFIPYPANDYVSYSLEYKDPNAEFPVWLESARGFNYLDQDRTNLISVNDLLRPVFFDEFLDDQDEKTSFSATEGRHEIQSKLKLKFKIVDERFVEGVTNSDWEDDLTDEIEKSITLFVTPPSIDDYNSTIGVIPMDDPNNNFGNQLDGNGEVFAGWVSSIKVKDVNGSTLPFRENPGDEKGIFYLSPMPDLFSQGVTYFRIIARDWRGIETKSEQMAVEVKATPPFIEGVEDYVPLEEELSAEALSTIDPMITAEDEFGNPIIFGSEGNASISLVRVIGPNSETPQTRIDQLEENFLYVLDYEATDSRGISSTVKRYLQVLVISPTIEIDPFRSSYDHGTAKDIDFRVEYTDPAQEYPTWLNDGVIAKVHDVETNQSIVYSGQNFFKSISSSRIDEGYSEQTDYEELFNSPGSYDLNFTIVDPRYEVGTTHPDWKDNLTFTTILTFEVVATKPAIEQVKELPQIIPMEDPGGAFKNWLDAISVADLEETALDYDQNASEGARFYLDPLPNLDPGFAVPDEETTSFEIVAIDSRGVEKRSDTLQVTVKATGAEITGSESLTFELSASLLNDLDPDITAVDEFNNTIPTNSIPSESIVLTAVSPGDYDGSNRLDELAQLSEGQTYTFTYQITDYRGVMVEENRYLAITATSPTLDVPDFQSERNLHPSGAPHAQNVLEYKDPWSELSGWLSSVSAQDFSGSSLSGSITLQVNGADHADFTTSPPDMAAGTNELTFEVIDPRYENGATNSDWLDDLTTQGEKAINIAITPPTFDEVNATLEHVQEVDGRDWLTELDPWIGTVVAKDVRGTDIVAQLVDSPDLTTVDTYDLNYTITDWRGIKSSISRSVEIIKTSPTLTITNGGWRSEFAFEENGIIEYMVQPREPYLAYDPSCDDGEFTILPASDTNESRKVYVQALSYDETDITQYVTVGGESINALSSAVVDYSALGTTQLTISIDDSLFRNFSSNGNGAVVSLSPTVQIVDKLGPYLKIPDGLEPFAVVGVANQAFPVPRIEIIDNYDSQEDIEGAFLEGSEFSYDGKDHTDYPDSNLWIDSDLPGIFGNEILMFSGNYPDYLTYQGIRDLSGNLMRNTESVTIDVNVTDSVAPVVTLRGGDPLYVDVNATLSGAESFADPGLKIVENLYVHDFGDTSVQLADGTVIWDYADYLMEKDLLVVEVQPFDENSQAYAEPLAGNPTIEQVLSDYNASQGDSSRYLLTYRFTDRAGNAGNLVTREVEFRNDPNNPSQVSFEPMVDDPYQVEAGDLSLSARPLVNAFIQFANGPVNTSILQKEVVLVTADGNSTGDEFWTPDLVNFYRDESGAEFFVSDSRPGGSIDFTPKDAGGLPKLVVRYSAYNEFEELFYYSLETRFVDETAPNFTVAPSGIVGDLQTGVAYVDQNVTGFEDAYNDGKSDTHQGLFSRRLLKDANEYLGPDGTEAFSHLEEEGFWSPGSYVVEYEVRDDFNNSRMQTRVLSVADGVAPHLAAISHAFLSAGSDLSASLDQVSENPVFTQAYVTSDKTDYDDGSSSLVIAPEGFAAGQDTEVPYVVASGDYDFILKLSEAETSIADDLGLELNSSSPQTTGSEDHDTDVTNLVSDAYGRSYAWHSAFKLNLGGQNFQDPGVYVENLSDYGITISSTIKAEYGEGGQLIKLTVTYFAEQDTEVQTNSIVRGDVAGSRVYTFVDEVIPVITLFPLTVNPNDDPDGPFVLLEAGEQYNDNDGQDYYMWESAAKSGALSTLNKSAYDAVDGPLDDSDFIETVRNLTDDINNTAVGASSQERLNDVFEITYLVSDFAGNQADPAYRYVVVKDTTAPVISDSAGVTERVVDIDYTLGFTDAQIRHNLLQLIAVIDFDDDVSVGSTVGEDPQIDGSAQKKWKVEWRQLESDPWQLLDENSTSTELGADPYPPTPDEAAVGTGYFIRISLTDDSGNESLYLDRKLRVIDTTPPDFTMLGESVIHDFYRYGYNQNLVNNQKTFDDQTAGPENPEYNGTGFDGGAHRLFLANYNFVDPGIYAEDDSFYVSVYPDYDGDGRGEARAVRKVDQTTYDDNASLDHGIIYTTSLVDTKSMQEFQEELAAGEIGGIPQNNIYIPDVNGTSFNDVNKTQGESMRIYVVDIRYKVKDGWGNIADTSRTLYVYESQQFSDSAFYATPLRDVNTNPNFVSLDGLTLAEKDTDGDGYSDFWEIAFGTRPDLASDKPAYDQSDPLLFSSTSIADIKSNMQKIKDTADYSALLNLRNLDFLDFNGSSP